MAPAAALTYGFALVVGTAIFFSHWRDVMRAPLACAVMGLAIGWSNLAYVLGSAETNPYHRQVYRVGLDGKGWTKRHAIEGTPPSPAFAAQYGAAPTRGRCSWTDVMLMMRPPCGDCRRIHGGAYAPEALYPARAVEVEGETISFALKTTPRVSCAKCGARPSAMRSRGWSGQRRSRPASFTVPEVGS